MITQACIMKMLVLFPGGGKSILGCLWLVFLGGAGFFVSDGVAG